MDWSRADLTLPRSPGHTRSTSATSGMVAIDVAKQQRDRNGNGNSGARQRRQRQRRIGREATAGPQRRIDVANGSRNRELATAGTATPIATGNPQRRIEKVIAWGQRKRTARKSWRHRGLDVRMRRKFGRRCVVRQSGGVRRGTEKRVERAVSRLHEDVTCSQLLRGAAMVVPRFTTHPFRSTLQK